MFPMKPLELTPLVAVQTGLAAPGFERVRMSPPPLPVPAVATHSDVEGQEIELKYSPPDLVHAPTPPVGLVEMKEPPMSSTATHREEAGTQETATMFPP